MNTIKIVYESGEGLLEEKKSRFLSVIRPIADEQEALDYLASLKKQYWDASHNCWAYVLGDRQQLQRCSDDGEPQGTAGRPMLDVLLGEDVHNAIAVVTRYFGGTLLGTGGLVRAYSKSVSLALENAVILEKTQGKRIRIRTDYNGYGKLQYLMAQNQIPITDTQFTDQVEMEIIVSLEEEQMIRKAVTEATSARAVFASEEEIMFGMADGKPILL